MINLPIKYNLSYYVAVIQWITSCDHTCNKTLARIRNVFDNVRVTMRFLIEIQFIFKMINYHKGPYDKQNLTRVVISNKIYEVVEGSFHKFHMK